MKKSMLKKLMTTMMKMRLKKLMMMKKLTQLNLPWKLLKLHQQHQKKLLPPKRKLLKRKLKKQQLRQKRMPPLKLKKLL